MLRKALRSLVPRGFRDALRARRDIRAWEAKLGEAARGLEPRPHGRRERVFITLTSYPPRFPTLHLTLLTLLQQTVRPDGILLWIADRDMARLPRKVKGLSRQGVSICSCEDVRSYKKLVFALEAYPDSILVTADDDANYPRDWLETLLGGLDPHEPVVVCYRAHRIAFTAGGEIAPYKRWERDIQDERARRPSTDIVPTGVGGVAYPPGCLSKEATDRTSFMRLSPDADDLWFYWMARRAGTRHRKVGGKFPRLTWPGTQEQRLYNRNALIGNDRQVKALLRAFGFPPAGPGGNLAKEPGC
jgi:hypothetical protein